MNDPDNFLSRWSRRKREAGEGKEKNETGEAVAAPAPENQQAQTRRAGRGAELRNSMWRACHRSRSISAETDITGFHANRRSPRR